MNTLFSESTGLYTDLYELTMAQGYFLSGRHEKPANFDYFFRSLPFDGGYVLFAGLSDVLDLISDFKYSEEDLAYLSKQGFKDEFLQYLKNFSFNGNLHSVKEGEVVFANEPVLRVEGTILECQLLETLILNIINFESLVATKASRIIQSADGRAVVDFGLRRSQGLGGNQASKAAFMGGVSGTSNVWAAKAFNIPVNGTMAHSWIQSFESEYKAFKTFADHYPDSTILLVDTYDTLASGLPNAIKVAKELEESDNRLKAIRLDSGDLAYLARQSRELLDEAGLDYVQIAVSNQLDEYLIKSLIDQGAPIDLFGVGTKLITAFDDPALDGVYKLSRFDDRPTLKISDNVEKITLPDIKKVYRLYAPDGSFYADAIALDNEIDLTEIIHPYYPNKRTNITDLNSEELLSPVLVNGKQVLQSQKPEDVASYAKKRLKKLPAEHKRFVNPHVYKVGISPELQKLRDELIHRG